MKRQREEVAEGSNGAKKREQLAMFVCPNQRETTAGVREKREEEETTKREREREKMEEQKPDSLCILTHTHSYRHTQHTH